MIDPKASFRGVVIVSPGGLTGSGGIGSVTRMMKTWFDGNCPDIRADVLDSRGEGPARWSFFYAIAALLRLAWIRARYRSEILHLHVSERSSFPRKGLIMALGLGLGMRTVLHHHGAEFIPSYHASSPLTKVLVRWVVKSAEVNIVLGEVWHRFLTSEIGTPAERVVVRFNAAVDIEALGQRMDCDPWHFLISANLSPRKGVDELLRAVRALAESGAPVKLTLAGGGQVDRYRRQAERLGIAPLCDFRGWRQGREIHDLFLSHSALILPSHNEGLPITVIEALGARLPVIATAVGSIPELLRDGVDCLLIEPGKPEEIAAAARRLADDPGLRQTLAANGRQVYERHFEVGAYMDRMLVLYGRLGSGQQLPG